MMSRILSALALVLTVLCACIRPEGLPVEPEPEPEIDTTYAAMPLTLVPDSLEVPVGTGIAMEGVGNSHFSIRVVNRRPTLTRCAVQQAYGDLLHCAELQRQGYIVLTLKQVELLLVDFGCEPPKRDQLPGTIVIHSCFGLTVYERMWDSTKVVFFPEDMDAMFKVTGCGNTWVGYRLKRRVGGGVVVHYPYDAVFGDTTHIRSIC